MLIKGNMNMMKVVVILGILLAPYALMHINAQEEVKVEIAEGSEKVDNGKFYVPPRITVPVGTTVVWKNFDDAAHTITSGTPTCVGECWGLDFDSGIMRLDEVYKFTFNKPRTYDYLCALHPWMIGKVKVLPEGASVEAEVSVTTDRTAYKLGDNVNVKGNVNPIITEQPVVIEVLNPGHAQFRSDTITVEDDGMFNYDFKLVGDLALPGSYTVRVTYSDVSTEITFVLEKPDKPRQKSPKLGEENEVGVADVRVAAKQVRDIVLIRVRNADDNASVYGITVQIPDSIIEAFKGPRDWSKPDVVSGEAVSSTSNDPIEPGEKAIFKLKIHADSMVINWTVYDDENNILDQGEVKPISFKGK